MKEEEESSRVQRGDEGALLLAERGGRGAAGSGAASASAARTMSARAGRAEPTRRRKRSVHVPKRGRRRGGTRSKATRRAPRRVSSGALPHAETSREGDAPGQVGDARHVSRRAGRSGRRGGRGNALRSASELRVRILCFVGENAARPGAIGIGQMRLLIVKALKGDDRSTRSGFGVVSAPSRALPRTIPPPVGLDRQITAAPRRARRRRVRLYPTRRREEDPRACHVSRAERDASGSLRASRGKGCPPD